MKIKIATYFGFDMTIDIPDEQYKEGDDKWYQDKFIEIRQKDIESACRKQREEIVEKIEKLDFHYFPFTDVENEKFYKKTDVINLIKSHDKTS